MDDLLSERPCLGSGDLRVPSSTAGIPWGDPAVCLCLECQKTRESQIRRAIVPGVGADHRVNQYPPPPPPGSFSMWGSRKRERRKKENYVSMSHSCARALRVPHIPYTNERLTPCQYCGHCSRGAGGTRSLALCICNHMQTSVPLKTF